MAALRTPSVAQPVPQPIQYRRDPAEFKPGELATVQWRRCRQRKQCFCCERRIDVGTLYAVIGVSVPQALCRGCHSVALGVGR